MLLPGQLAYNNTFIIMCDFRTNIHQTYFLSHTLPLGIILRITDCDLSIINVKYPVNNGLASMEYELSSTHSNHNFIVGFADLINEYQILYIQQYLCRLTQLCSVCANVLNWISIIDLTYLQLDR